MTLPVYCIPYWNNHQNMYIVRKSSHSYGFSSFEYFLGCMSAVVHLGFLVVSVEAMRIRTIVPMNEGDWIWQLDMYMLECYVCECKFFLHLIYVVTYGKRKVVGIVLFYSFVILNFTPLNLFTIYPFFIVWLFCIPFRVVYVEKWLISFVYPMRITEVSTVFIIILCTMTGRICI